MKDNDEKGCSWAELERGEFSAPGWDWMGDPRHLWHQEKLVVVFSPLYIWSCKSLVLPSFMPSSSIFIPSSSLVILLFLLCSSYEPLYLSLKYFSKALEIRLSVLTVEVSGTYTFCIICFLWFVIGKGRFWWMLMCFMMCMTLMLDEM